jgi:elongation factor 1-beta
VVLRDLKMGEVLCTLRVMPTGVDVDLEKMKSEIQSLSPNEITESPVAFGLKALVVKKIIPDDQGGSDVLEDKIRKIEGVESVETIGVTLV